MNGRRRLASQSGDCPIADGATDQAPGTRGAAVNAAAEAAYLASTFHLPANRPRLIALRVTEPVPGGPISGGKTGNQSELSDANADVAGSPGAAHPSAEGTLRTWQGEGLAGNCLSPLECTAGQSRHCDTSTFWLLASGSIWPSETRSDGRPVGRSSAERQIRNRTLLPRFVPMTDRHN